ncbi:hypothetical protein ACTFIT_004242 [Dictyostelium discoideum]
MKVWTNNQMKKIKGHDERIDLMIRRMINMLIQDLKKQIKQVETKVYVISFRDIQIFHNTYIPYVVALMIGLNLTITSINQPFNLTILFTILHLYHYVLCIFIICFTVPSLESTSTT